MMASSRVFQALTSLLVGLSLVSLRLRLLSITGEEENKLVGFESNVSLGTGEGESYQLRETSEFANRHRASLQRYGSDTGGWYVDSLCLIAKEEKSTPVTVYSVGAGEDISWDLAMIQQFGAKVHIFDPTEKSNRYVTPLVNENDGNLFYWPEAMSNKDGVTTFALPADPSHVSMRQANLAGDVRDKTVTAKVDTLRNWMSRRNHTHLDILKLDIEGSEYDVLEAMVEENNLPFTQLLVAFHPQFLDGSGFERHEHLVKMLEMKGLVELWSRSTGEKGYLNSNILSSCEPEFPRPYRTVHYDLKWDAISDSVESNSSTTKGSADLTIVVLTMNRISSLQRLIASLLASEYEDDVVDLIVHVDRPESIAYVQAWNETIEWIENDVEWKFGKFEVVVASENLGLRQAWFDAWAPEDDAARAIILEDDVEVSHMWYSWVKGAYSAYANRSDLAGISLQRQQFVPYKGAGNAVPTNEHQPFLYRLLGSIGFAPVATVWKKFVQWTKCALMNDVNIYLPTLITSDFYYGGNKRMMWTQHFIYFTNHFGLYTLYLAPPHEQALAAHWREIGAHFNTPAGKDFELVNTSLPLTFLPNVPKYDWKADLVEDGKTLIISIAIGHDLNTYHSFIDSLRLVYDGEVCLLVEESITPQILDYLLEKRVKIEKINIQPWKNNKEKSNHDRFEWYTTVCQNYWLCMAIAFKNTAFQSSPFAGLDVEMETELFLYQHHLRMDVRHLEEVIKCNNQTDIASFLAGQFIVNAGGIIATPPVFSQLAQLSLTYSQCDDQILLNMVAYTDLITNKIKLYKHGDGNINIVTEGIVAPLNNANQVLNANCLVTPVVHYSE